MGSPFDLVLAALDGVLADAWADAFADAPRARVHRGSILDVACDAVVSPANSLGYMFGGIDAVYADHFPGIEDRVQAEIRSGRGGELPVGDALLVPTGHADIPHLIVAPTMSSPDLDVSATDHPYRAARAVFRLVVEDAAAAHVRTIAMPGLGTGVGGVRYRDCARQVRVAYDEVVQPTT